MAGFEVRNKKLQDLLILLGKGLKGTMPEGVGFVLLMFDQGPGKGLFYSSDSNRQDVILAMKEFILKSEKDSHEKIV